MSQDASREHDPGVAPVPVNADLEIPDKVLGPFTARQAAILAAGAVMLWAIYAGLHRLIPPIVIAVVAVVLGGALVASVTARRDGLTLDRYGLAALRHHRARRILVPAEPGEPVPARTASLQLPVAGLGEPGVLDLGADGAAVLIECGTVNLALRSGGEVRTVLASFAQALNALGGAFQFLICAHRIDLTVQAERIETGAPGLPHPLLEDRARSYAGYLRALGRDADLVGRRVLLVLREEGPAHAAASAVLHRAAQACQLLSGCSITARVLDAAEASAALATACDATRTASPARLAPPELPVGVAGQDAAEADELPYPDPFPEV